MLLLSILMGIIIYPYWYPYTYPYPDAWTTLNRYANRFSTLLFIATITTATLATAGLDEEDEDLLAEISIYLFTAAMVLLFITIMIELFRF